ncbi:palmitoyltransferase ZDHHC14 isoform X3 [Leguminivora glycinivorella]|uniref:palmitoyltransferase ZDHHC14 isoform X3 n=1 Tax=Leguminivora glycinivorella TaxID=1035111 RepID=UPI00200E85C3|nr:palmitoyltransferase ZDHHC14 isoform X3 [Leguminivora glycinivorella]XP_047986176.1 palmitoyltransferase ZDHHC14 isoform X3 [Leguminivora glycinivorella]
MLSDTEERVELLPYGEARRVSPALPAAGAALAALTLCALLRTALTDPGILPRAAPAEAALDAPTATAARPPPRAREVLVRGRVVKLKYCFTCKLFRPPRASHCSLCDNCVERFDHHCPWVGNCVGRRNYRAFYTFVVSLSFLAVFVFACAVAHVALEARSMGLAAALRKEPASALAAGVCFLSVWSVLGLAGFHTYLASTDQTTNEDIKGSFSSRRGSGNPNPYSRGNACANCWHVLCGPLAPSLIDRRGIVTPDNHEDLPPAFVAALAAPAPVTLQPAADHNAGTGSYSNLFTVTPVGNHAYLNHSLDLDPTPLNEVCIGGSTVPSAATSGTVSTVANSSAVSALSAARLRLLHDTTMIDAALDLDEPEPPPHLHTVTPPRIATAQL